MATNDYVILKASKTYGKDNLPTQFKISLDEIDLGLLPWNKLLSQYNGEQTKPIWEMATDLKPLKELSAAADQYVELQVSAEESGRTNYESSIIGNLQCCQLCDIEIPVLNTKDHLKSQMHRNHLRLANHMLNKMKQRTERPLAIPTKQAAQNLFYCTCCNTVLKKHSQSTHTKTDKHKLCVKKEEVLTKFIDLYTNYKDHLQLTITQTKQSNKESKIDANGNSALVSGVEDQNIFAVKEIGKSYVEVTAANGDIITVSKEHWQGIVKINRYFDCYLCNLMGLKLNKFNKHVNGKLHKIFKDTVIWDRHANREIYQTNTDETWNHCVICNVIHYNQDYHKSTRHHVMILHNALALNKLNQSVAEPEQSITGAKHSTAKPEQSIFGANHNVAKPEQIITRPKQSEANPEKIIFGAKHNVAKPEQFMTGPKQSEAKPEQIIFKAKHIVAKPEQFITGPKQSEAKPEQIIFGANHSVAKPEQIITGPKQSKAKPEQMIFGAKHIVAKPEQNITEPKHSIAKPKQIITGPKQSEAISGQIITEPNHSEAKPEQIIFGPKHSVAKQEQIITEPNTSTALTGQTITSKQYADKETNTSVKHALDFLKESILKSFDIDIPVQLGDNVFMVSRMSWHNLFLIEDFVLCQLCVKCFPLSLINMLEHLEQHEHLLAIESKENLIRKRINKVSNNKCLFSLCGLLSCCMQ